MRTIRNLVGEKFERLTVIEFVGKNKFGFALWKCNCDCGNTTVISYAKWRKTKSCGCLKNELTSQRRKKHKEGEVKTKEYRTWQDIKTRCYNQHYKFYNDYGGRGIIMYEAWINSFESFLADVGRSPSPKHTIDRYPNNDGNYEPGNVRWATREEQMNNTRSCIYLEYNGERLTKAQWARKFNVSYAEIRWMIEGKGMSIEDIANSLSFP